MSLYIYIYVITLLSIIDLTNSKVNLHKADAITWCSYIHFTQEPELIVYNSIPDTGNKKLNSIIDIEKKYNKHLDIIHINHTNGYWNIDLDSHYEKGLELSSLIKDEILKSTVENTLQYIVEGQWYFHHLHDHILPGIHINKDISTSGSASGSASIRTSASHADNKGFVGSEHIQLVRSCYEHIRDSIVSIIYEKFKIFKSYQYGNNNNNDETLFLKSQLPAPIVPWNGCDVTLADNCFDNTIVSLTIKECLSNLYCFINLNCIIEEIELRNMPKYFCGPSCSHHMSHTNIKYATSDVNSTVAGAMERIYMRKEKTLVHQSVRYTTIGTYELFDEYLEMLECAYPTAFRNASQYSHYSQYKSRYLIPSSDSYVDYYTTAIDRYAIEYCDSSGANLLYSDIQRIFRARIKLMRLKKNTCCRKAKNI